MPKIFISYRREDTEYIAASIYKQLKSHFGKEEIFFDTDGIPAGSDFRKYLTNEIQQCQVLIAIIGPRWLGFKEETGFRRIDDPRDWVRFEIESALARDILVIPLLVKKARLPKQDELPESLQNLVFRHTTTLRPGIDFDTDLDRLVSGIETYLASYSSSGNLLDQPIEDVQGESSQLEDSQGEDSQLEKSRTEAQPHLGQPRQLLIALGLFVIVCLVGLVAWATGQGGSNTPLPTLNSPAGKDSAPKIYSSDETTNKLISAGDKDSFEGMPPLSTNYPQPDDYPANYESERLTYAELKQKGIEEFAAGRYQNASQIFSDIRNTAAEHRRNAAEGTERFKAATQALQDPEVLIFKNNAEVRRRKQQGEQIYVIAAAVPLTNAEGQPFDIGKQMLQGIAQAQDKAVNLGIPKSNIEVVIANDRNIPQQAAVVAAALTQLEQPVLAVVGHYLSESTCEALKLVYNDKPIVVVSPLSTASYIRRTCGGSTLFFRTTASTTIEAKTLIEQLEGQMQGKPEVKVAIFYLNEFYSEDLLQEFQTQISNAESRQVDISIEGRIFNLSDEEFNTATIMNSIKEVDALIVIPDGRNTDSISFDRALEVIRASNREQLVLGSNPLYSSDAVAAGGGTDSLKSRLFLATDWHEDCAGEEFRIKTNEEYWYGSLNRVAMMSYEAVQSLVPTLSENVTSDQIRDKLNSEDNAIQSDVFKDKTISFLSASKGSNSTGGFLNPGDRKEIESRILVTVGDSEISPFIVVDNENNRINMCL